MDPQPVSPSDPTTPVPPSTNPVTPSSAPVQAAPAPSAEATLPHVPESWPASFGIYKFSKQAVKLNLVTLIVIWVLTLVVSLVLDALLKKVGQVISYGTGGLATAAYTLTYLAGVRGQSKSVGQALQEALPFWLKIIGLNILVFISIAISILLLIIPFFFVVPRLLLANYFLIDKNMGIIEAYKASWEATKGNVGKVWGILGATIAMAILMITIIGIPFSIYFLVMYSAAFAVLYEFLGKKSPAVAAPVAPAAPTPVSAPPQNPTIVQ
jgi:hypothetical protein